MYHFFRSFKYKYLYKCYQYFHVTTFDLCYIKLCENKYCKGKWITVSAELPSSLSLHSFAIGPSSSSFVTRSSSAHHRGGGQCSIIIILVRSPSSGSGCCWLNKGPSYLQKSLLARVFQYTDTDAKILHISSRAPPQETLTMEDTHGCENNAHLVNCFSTCIPNQGGQEHWR